MLKARLSIKSFLLALALLYIIYEPSFSSLMFGVHPYIFNVLVFGAIICLYFIIHRNVFRYLFGEYRVFEFIVAIIVYALYTLVITSLLGDETRFFQHIYVVVQILILYVLNDYINRNTPDPDIYRMLLLKTVVIIEFISCVLMLLSPRFKELGIELYYAESSAEISEWITSKRIFGLFGDYTFKCQIFNGMLAFFFIFLTFIEKKKDGYIYAMMALFISVMNGRTGTLIFTVQIVLMIVLFLILYPKAIYKTIKILIVSGISVAITLIVISVASPRTYAFLMNMVLSVIGDESSTDQTIKVLMYAIKWPSGWGLVFGTGDVYYGTEAGADIGFCNDVILVGVPMTILLYCAIFYFVFVRTKEKNNLALIYNLCILAGLLIANFKGVCLRNGTIVIGCLWLRMILEERLALLNKVEKRKGILDGRNNSVNDNL